MKKNGHQALTKIVCSEAALEEHLECWEELAKNAIEPNVFYEPGPLLAALRNANENLSFLCVLIFQEVSTGQQKKINSLAYSPFNISNHTLTPTMKYIKRSLIVIATFQHL